MHFYFAWDHIKTVFCSKMQMQCVSNVYMLRYLFFVERIVKVDQSVLALSDKLGTILKQIPSQNSTWKSPQRSIFANISITC